MQSQLVIDSVIDKIAELLISEAIMQCNNSNETRAQLLF